LLPLPTRALLKRNLDKEKSEGRAGHACAQDELLKAERLDFIRLRNEEGIRELIDAGYAYAQRTEAAGGFERFFGSDRGALHAPNAAVFT
jgi:hypothetical protein